MLRYWTSTYGRYHSILPLDMTACQTRTVTSEHNINQRTTTMSIIPGINLPWPILAHAVGLTFLGLKYIYRPSPPPPGRASEISSMLGITTTGLGLAYLSTAYMPVHENQFLHASALVRMILAGLAGVKLLVSRNEMSAGQWNDFLGVLLYDGIGGFLVGWWLGTWSGRVPRFRA